MKGSHRFLGARRGLFARRARTASAAQVEEDLDEVLQVVQVFSNVSQGVAVPKKKLAKAFPGLSTDEIIREILAKGRARCARRAHDR